MRGRDSEKLIPEGDRRLQEKERSRSWGNWALQLRFSLGPEPNNFNFEPIEREREMVMILLPQKEGWYRRSRGVDRRRISSRIYIDLPFRWKRSLCSIAEEIEIEKLNCLCLARKPCDDTIWKLITYRQRVRLCDRVWSVMRFAKNR